MTSNGRYSGGPGDTHWESSGGPGKRVLLVWWTWGKRVRLVWWTRGKESSDGPGGKSSGGPGEKSSGGHGEKSSAGLVDMGKRERVLLVWWISGKESSAGSFCDHRPPDQWEFWSLANVCVVWSQALGTRYLEWPEDYSLEKVLPLTTLWDQLDISSGSPPTASDHLKPSRCLLVMSK